MTARFRLVNIGRSKFCGSVDARTPQALLKAVRPHLASHSVEITGEGAVLVGGCREVGHVEPLDDIARAWLRRWSWT